VASEQTALKIHIDFTKLEFIYRVPAKQIVANQNMPHVVWDIPAEQSTE
jgi:hypothetical protein